MTALTQEQHARLAAEILAAGRHLDRAFTMFVNGKVPKKSRLARAFHKLVCPVVLGTLKMAAEDAACRDLGTQEGMSVWSVMRQQERDR